MSAPNEEITSKGKHKEAEIMANTINVTIHPNDGLILATLPKTPESAKNTPHQNPAPTKPTVDKTQWDKAANVVEILMKKSDFYRNVKKTSHIK